jgi:septal ring factor EnvC (AmiA/AmiB activator)
MLARALDDLSAIANLARAAPDAARVALKRANRIEKRLDEIHDELASMDRRLRKMNKRIDRSIEETHSVNRAMRSAASGLERVGSGIDVMATQLERDGGGKT